MTDYKQHPITPPPELVKEWFSLPLSTDEVLVIAAQWGADQELEACCEVVRSVYGARDFLQSARRPKPPSLKEQALKALSEMEDDCLMVTHAATIRNALESIDD